MTKAVRIVEVGPRDGLQNEPHPVSVTRRLELIAALAAAGLSDIEVGSFVSPAWVPQMAGTEGVLAGLSCPGRYHVLVPNLRGWERFVAARLPGVDYVVSVFVSASEGFSMANLNCSVAQSLERVAPVIAAATGAGVTGAGVTVRGYVSCVTDCPFDGPVDPQAVAEVTAALRRLAPMEVSLGDTIGAGTPETVGAMLAAVTEVAPARDLSGHFHDTGGRALANVEVALRFGLRSFDASVGGLGGCPYAPGAPGNLATEALVARLEALGYATGVDPARLQMAAALAVGLREA